MVATTNPPLPDLSKLTINGFHGPPPAEPPELPDDIAAPSPDDPAMDRLRTYVKSLPYSVEPNSHMQNMLDFFLARLVQCVKAKDFDRGFPQWDTMLT